MKPGTERQSLGVGKQGRRGARLSRHSDCVIARYISLAMIFVLSIFLLIIIEHIYDRWNIILEIRLQIGPTKNICNGSAITKFITTVWGYITGNSAIIPFCSSVPAILIKWTITQTVKVCMQRIVKNTPFCGIITLKARCFATLPTIKKSRKNPIIYSGKKECEA